MSLPHITVLNLVNTSFHVCVREDNGELWGEVNSDGVFNGPAKFEVVRAQLGVHLRSLFNNKYLVKDASSNYLSAKGDEAVEDTSAQNCTLFTVENRDNAVLLKHVQTGMYLDDSLRQDDQPFRLILNDRSGSGLGSESGSPANIVAVDLEAVIKLPTRVVLKCYTGEYLKPTGTTREEYEDFIGTDPNDTLTWYVTSYDPLGNLRLVPFCLWSQGHKDEYACALNNDGLRTAHNGLPLEAASFRVLQMNDNFSISLINYQGKFLQKTPSAWYKAEASSAVREAIVEMGEPVISRTVELRYRLQDAISYDLKPRNWLSAISTNSTDEPFTTTLTIQYSKTKSFSLSVSATASYKVTTTFKGGIPLLAETGFTVEIGVSITGSFGHSWDKSVTETGSVTITVPPRSRRRARIVAMEGKCDVPFSYEQVEEYANGDRHVTTLSDGVYKGLNGYEFVIEVFDPDEPTNVTQRFRIQE